MRRAIALARRGWGQTAPNPMVGAVIVRDGVVVGEGHHERHGGPHAEVHALAAAGAHARGATVYVTLEPCAHHGKTPPCVDALIAAGVARVVIGAFDPNPTAGGGAERLRGAGIDVEIGVEARAAHDVDPAFFFSHAATRPWVTLKLAVSLDGAIADAHGRSRWITGPRARAEVHRLRAGHDAVAVGLGTALADDPLLTVRDAPAPRVPPKRVVFDRLARLPVTSALAQTAREVPTVIVAETPDPDAARALEMLGVEVIAAPSLADGLVALYRSGVRSMLVEGGARLTGSLWDQSAVDRLIIFQSPVVLGAGARGAFAFVPSVGIETARRLPVRERRAVGDDVMTVYAVHEVPASDAGTFTAG